MFIRLPNDYKVSLSYKRLAIRYLKVAAYTTIGALAANINSAMDTATLVLILKTSFIAGLIAVLHKAQKELKP